MTYWASVLLENHRHVLHQKSIEKKILESCRTQMWWYKCMVNIYSIIGIRKGTIRLWKEMVSQVRSSPVSAVNYVSLFALHLLSRPFIL